MSNLKPEGMSYFPFSVDLFEDEALERVRDEFGVVVNSVYVLMLCYLYKKKGYYIPYSTNKEKEDLHWYIYKRVQGGKYKIQLQVLPKVIEALVARELFSRELSPKIITSKRAQETYYRATVDRKAVEINPDYWLLNDVEMRKISQKHPYYLMLHPELKSDEDKAKSVDFEYKSGNFTLKGKGKENISSNEDIEVSKKESNKEKKNQSYDELFEEMGVKPIVKEALIEFIRHLQANGTILINSRLEDIIVGLDMRFMTDEAGKVKYIKDAISKGYKRLPFEGEE